MVDTVRMPRPHFERRRSGLGGPGGRVEHDMRGMAVWVRTRATDTPDSPAAGDFSLVDAVVSRADSASRLPPASRGYYEHESHADASRRPPVDLQALSRWIELKKKMGSNRR